MEKASVLLLSILLSFITISSKIPEKTGNYKNEKMKVMSYNIHIASPPSVLPEFSLTDLKAVAAVINKEKPDLIALQEVDAYTVRSGKTSHQAKELAEMTGMYYHFAKAIDRSEGDYGVAILSRKPILDSATYKLPVTEGSTGETRALGVITVDALGQKLVFMSVHLDHRSDKDRQFQAEEILRVTKKYDKYPIILCGDFNSNPDNNVFNVIKERFVMCSKTQPLTFSSENPRKTLDYMLMNKKAFELFNIQNYSTVDEKYASDHLPIKMEVVRK